MRVEPYKTELCQANAYWMAKLALAVYTTRAGSERPDDQRILTELKAEDARFVSVTPTSRNSAQAILVEHEDYWCFAFRGTDEIRDWLDNLNAFPERVLFGEFHRGFWNSTEDVWQPLFEHYRDGRAADRQARTPRPVFLTGHSLGGAMATIAAARLVHEDQPFSSTYTFGQPRAMTLETARIFNADAKGRFHRFQNNSDIVTRLPSRLMGYSHVGSCRYISQDKRIHEDVGAWFRFLDTVTDIVESASELRLDLVEDHAMVDYLAAIRAWDRESG